ncbi:hypothetical protein LJR289_002013 [Pseudoduganella sp. LjRoot289]|uniref:hypothetical protein n=1 Tax=Pseudoduganella sp. LjRoot289 TaxID=3342314 RepID=UPI003ED0A126
MGAATEKDYMDAKLETINTRMEGRFSAHEAAVDSKFSALRSDMHKGFADMTKWIVGTVVGVAAVSVTTMTFVLNNATPKGPLPSPAPIVIYATPPASAAAPAATAPPANHPPVSQQEKH